MDDTAYKSRWFQFTISRILWATFWVALSFGLFAGFGWREFDHWIPVVGLIVTGGVCPFIAAGVLFGRPRTGFAIGLILVGIYATVVALQLRQGTSTTLIRTLPRGFTLAMFADDGTLEGATAHIAKPH